MARMRMVTRTIESTKVVAMCAVVSEAKVENREFVVPQTYANNEKLLKALKKQVETEDLKIVAITSSGVQQKMYGMLESDFLAVAKELDENRKMTDVEEVEAVEE